MNVLWTGIQGFLGAETAEQALLALEALSASTAGLVALGRDVQQALLESQESGMVIRWEDPEEAKQGLRRLLGGVGDWGLFRERIHRPDSPYRFSDQAIDLARRTLGGNEVEEVAKLLLPPELDETTGRRVVQTFRDQFALTSDQLFSLLRAMREAGYSLEIWKAVPDMGHNSVGMEVVKKHLSQSVDIRSLILLSNPYFVSYDLSLTTGLPHYSEYDVLIRTLLKRHWERFENAQVRTVQLLHAMVYMDKGVRLAYHQYPRSMERLSHEVLMAVELARATLRLMEEGSKEFQKALRTRWGGQLPSVLVAIEGRRERFERLDRLTPDILGDAFKWGKDSDLQLPQNQGGLNSSSLYMRLLLERFVLKQELTRAFLDGMDPHDITRQRELRQRLEEELKRFAVSLPVGRDGDGMEEAAGKFSGVSLVPRPKQVQRGRKILKRHGFQPSRVFELSGESFHALVRGGSYSAVALNDGRLLAALKTDESLLHLFLRFDEQVDSGWLSEERKAALYRKMSEPLNGAAFEFSVDEEGVPHLINRSGSYGTPVGLMEGVRHLFKLKRLPYRFESGEQYI